MNPTPYFTIVIPVFNREIEVVRAIKSCLAQEFRAFELLVVDDGSTDRSATVVEALQDKRVRLIRHVSNRGQCPARNTGVGAAVGKWVPFLDSDDELLPGCLMRSFEITSDPSAKADRFAFPFLHDDGCVSPERYPTQSLMGYHEWLGFTEQNNGRRNDPMWVTNRTTFHDCQFPDSHAQESSYHLAFALKYMTRFVPEISGVMHMDAVARITGPKSGAIDWTTTRDRSREEAADSDKALARHGTALRRFAPGKYGLLLQISVVEHTVGGNRLDGVQNAFRLLLFRPSSGRSWTLLILSLLGARAMNCARLYNNRRSHVRAKMQHETPIGGPQGLSAQ